MKVKLIAKTELVVPDVDYLLPYKLHPIVGYAMNAEAADELGEIAGRLCYKSWNRPNPATASNQGYINNIIKQAHYSVLEHASASFWISGVSRSLTHELVRHRHLSFSQVSQRYVDESDGDFVLHPAIKRHADVSTEVLPFNSLSGTVANAVNEARLQYEGIVEALELQGIDRKTARGAARSVLPNAVPTEMIVTGNHGAWREVLRKRLGAGADAEIQELAKLLLQELRKLAPNTYQDFPYEYPVEQS